LHGRGLSMSRPMGRVCRAGRARRGRLHCSARAGGTGHVLALAKRLGGILRHGIWRRMVMPRAASSPCPLECCEEDGTWAHHVASWHTHETANGHAGLAGRAMTITTWHDDDHHHAMTHRHQLIPLASRTDEDVWPFPGATRGVLELCRHCKSTLAFVRP